MAKKFLVDIDVKGSVSQTNATSSMLKADETGKIVSAIPDVDYLLTGGGGSGSSLSHEVKAGESINKGQAVYVSSADGTNMIVSKASNHTESTSSKTLGLIDASVLTNDIANVITEGLLDGLDTSLANAGDPVWLGTEGSLIFGLANKPTAPAHLVSIGVVTRAQQNNGEIFVKVQNGFETEELHDVIAAGRSANDVLHWDGSINRYASITSLLGYTPYNSTNPSGYITGINSTMVINALGYTPYNSSNPNGYITSSASITGGSSYLTGGDSSFYALLYNSLAGDLNNYNSAGLYSAEYTGSSNKPGGFSNGHFIQISDAGGTDVKTQWYYNDAGDKIAMRLMWGNGAWKSWRNLIHDGNIGSYGYITANVSGDFKATDVYTTGGWFRNHSNTNGIYWSTTGWHLMPYNNADFRVHSGDSGAVSLRMETNGSTRGYFYANSSSEIGILNSGRNWVFRMQNNGDAIMDYNYGCSIVGVYSASRYQGVWSMGNAYKLSADGTSPGSLYGLAWSHPNAGGQAGYLTNHGLIHMMYGTAFATISDNIWCRNNITAYSDIRVKENIEVIPNAMEKINAIRGVTFTRNDTPDKSKRHVGVIAQEIEKVLPEVITKNESNGHLSVAYGNISALTIEGLKEHDIRINEQQKTINLLISQIKYLNEVINGIAK